ncbi:diaminopimelate epimerase [Thermosipho ferrireducens]|uniref:Diaminopimelate epimerase n=1 Tax=Thermosipho ferrireducens TaxID=2571116 RepID=A0ABX7S861_9BACT|nr:diaminopimelate epimerase [Thermosipho ferrireducens]QTA38784.1 diaminopimelate epimerase [Thermosipho ferrireducens]
MKIEKYTATGNSFIICDTKNTKLTDDEKTDFVIKYVKDRDGVIFVELTEKGLFMDYFNRDGKRAAFCGNGARTFLAYVKKTDYIKKDLEEICFETHAGKITGKITPRGIQIKMPEITEFKQENVDGISGFSLKVGVPHFVVFVNNVNEVDVNDLGKSIRKKLNSNVNFVQILKSDQIRIRTFERGVEKETLACGTGATASAYVTKHLYKWKSNEIEVLTKGGILYVAFSGNSIFLEGGVENV